MSVVRVNASDGSGMGKDVAIVASACNDAPVLNLTRLLARSDLVSVVDVGTSTIPPLNFSIEVLDFDTDALYVEWTSAFHESEGVYSGPGAGTIAQIAGDEAGSALMLLDGPDMDDGEMRLVGNGTEHQASVRAASASVAPTKLGVWTVGFLASDGCTNVSGNVTARVICPVTTTELPPLPETQIFTKYVGDDFSEGGAMNRSVTIEFNASANGSDSGVPALLSWSLLS